MQSSTTTGISYCIGCGGEVRPGDRFCGSCGTSLLRETARASRDAFSVLTPSLIFYFVTLSILGVYKLTDVFDASFESFAIVSIATTLIVVAFWIMAGKDLVSLFDLKGIRISVVLLTIVIALVSCLVVSVVADFINVSLYETTFVETLLFEDTSSPLLYAILFTCVQPAIFEEVAFRGFLFNNIQQITTPTSTVYITAFIFGIIHLAIISMLWLVPLGLAFGFLRAKYNTLWYGIIGHFTYNLGVVLIEYAQTVG